MSLVALASCRPTATNHHTPLASKSERPHQHREPTTVEVSGCGGLPCRGQGGMGTTSDETSNYSKCVPSHELPVIQTCTCDIVADAKKRWASSGYASLKSIDCVCVDGVLVIQGIVSSYYYKQLAQECVRGVEGIQRIANELKVPDWNKNRTNH